MIVTIALAALAQEPEAPEMAPPSPPWERDIRGVELLIAQPVVWRVFRLHRRPDVLWPAPVEGAIGHVVLRLVDDGPADQQWTVQVSAYMDRDGDGVDDPSNVILGLVGGYDLRLLIEPLPVVATRYAEEHSRWIRRFVLPMQPAEVDAFLAEVREAAARSDAHELGGYWFFTENCATELTQMLDVALLGRPRELNYPYTLPRKYERRGFVTPAVATVTPADAADGGFASDWALPAVLAAHCADADDACAAAWVEAGRAAYGEAWLAEMADRSQRRAYERRLSPELLARLAEVAGE